MLFRTPIRLAAFALAIAAPLAAQQAPATPTAGGVAVVDVTKGQAVVLDVNYSIRNVTVTINGELHNYTLSDSLKGIMNIKKGDTLNVEIAQELAVYLKLADQPAVGSAASLFTVQPKGKPAMSRVKVNELTGSITKLNYTTRVMSIVVPPKMDTMTFIADTSLHDLHGMKVGDKVVMRYTQGVVVSIANK